MTTTGVLTPPSGEGIRIDAWQCPVTAWPAATGGPDEFAIDIETVQQRVHEALGIELATMSIGGGFRVVTALGGGQCEVEVYRTGQLPNAPTTHLGSVVGLGEWTRAAEPLPQIGGDLVIGVLPTDVFNLPVQWTAFQARAQGGDGAALSVWSRLADRLAHNPLPIALVAEVVRVGVPGPSQELLAHALTSRAQARTERRAQRFEGSSPAVPSLQHAPAGDFVMAVGVVGDMAALLSAWRAETGHSLRRADDPAISELSRNLLSTVTASDFASLLPLPVLSAHSTVPVRRFRPRSTTVTRPGVGRAVVVARTDSGASIGLEADSVNRNLLVIGDVGSGKSTTTMSLLTDLWNDHGIPWLVIDPLKYEYARLRVAARPGERQQLVPVRHLHLGQIPLNPLIVPSGVSPLSFASAMAQAFSSTSALGEAFPLGEQIARTAFNDLYDDRTVESAAPTFADLEAALMAATHRDGLTGETVNNIRASLLGRLRAITSGVAGDIFAGGPRARLDWEVLSRFPTVITFPPGLGQQEKAVIYALLVAAHWSWRLANPVDGRHLIVLEEVHQVYGRSNPIAAAVLDSLLATMRSSGQGYFAVTQTPHQLDEQTQRLFPNIVAHRIRHRDGLEILHSLGGASAEVADLDNGEVVALLGETYGVRGRVTDRTETHAQSNPMRPLDSYRAEEFTLPGPRVRGWCSACPRPCHGRSWLSLAPHAARAADAVLATSSDVSVAARASVDAVRAAASLATPGPIDHPSGVYCASARGLTVALGVRGASDAVARRASEQVRHLVVSALSSRPSTGR